MRDRHITKDTEHKSKWRLVTPCVFVKLFCERFLREHYTVQKDSLSKKKKHKGSKWRLLGTNTKCLQVLSQLCLVCFHVYCFIWKLTKNGIRSIVHDLEYFGEMFSNFIRRTIYGKLASSPFRLLSNHVAQWFLYGPTYYCTRPLILSCGCEPALCCKDERFKCPVFIAMYTLNTPL